MSGKSLQCLEITLKVRQKYLYPNGVKINAEEKQELNDEFSDHNRGFSKNKR